MKGVKLEKRAFCNTASIFTLYVKKSLLNIPFDRKFFDNIVELLDKNLLSDFSLDTLYLESFEKAINGDLVIVFNISDTTHIIYINKKGYVMFKENNGFKIMLNRNKSVSIYDYTVFGRRKISGIKVSEYLEIS